MDPASAATTPTVRGPSTTRVVVRRGGDTSLPGALSLTLPLPLILWPPLPLMLPPPLPLMLPPPLPKLESLWRPLLTPPTAAARPLMGLRAGVMPLPFTQKALRDGALARSTRCGLVPPPNVLSPRATEERPADTRTGVPGLRRVGVLP
jgi:hypothetical protein